MKNKNIGIIKLIGNTNVGKSTLFNKIFSKKISITAKKKNLTITEINQKYLYKNLEIIYIDTPGINIYENFYNNVDIINFIIEMNKISIKEINIINKINNKIPLILIINKIDKYKYQDLFKFIKYLKDKIIFKELIPISAKNNLNIEKLKLINENILLNLNLEKKNSINNTFDIQNNSIKIFKEITREKIFRFLGDELPYQIKEIQVNILDKMKIFINIILKNKNNKKIFIGKNGNKIKQIGINIRYDIEKILKKKIYLILNIK